MHIAHCSQFRGMMNQNKHLDKIWNYFCSFTELHLYFLPRWYMISVRSYTLRPLLLHTTDEQKRKHQHAYDYAYIILLIFFFLIQIRQNFWFQSKTLFCGDGRGITQLMRKIFECKWYGECRSVHYQNKNLLINIFLCSLNFVINE